MDRDYDVLFRIMILGDTGVGKTCLLQRFCDNEFRYSHVCTIGIDFKMKTLVMDGIRVRVQIWDTAGQERYRTITKQYFRKAQGIILTYDVTEETSFSNVRNWASDIHEYGDEEVSIILAGNKSDREDSRAITTGDAEKLAADLEMPFMEVSAYTSENVSEMFTTITRAILEKHRDEVTASLKEKYMATSSESESESSNDEGIVKDISRKPIPSKGGRGKLDGDLSCCVIL